MALIEFDHITKIYRRGFRALRVRAVTDLSFTIDKPGVYGFVGGNGAGKTTSLKMLLGLVRPTAGRVTIRGIDSAQPRARRHVAYVAEQPVFYQHLSAREALQFYYHLCGFAHRLREEAIDTVLHRMELAGHDRRRVHEFSKGMQQRLSMAQALLGDSGIFILDEPMSGLDPLGRRLFRTIIRELANQGRCVFFSTHILDDIETLCDHVIALNGGTLAYNGTIGDLLSRGGDGMEIVLDSLEPHLQAACGSAGAQIVVLHSGALQLYTPTGGDYTACMRILANNGVVPRTITPRTRPIEEVLYGTAAKGVS